MLVNGCGAQGAWIYSSHSEGKGSTRGLRNSPANGYSFFHLLFSLLNGRLYERTTPKAGFKEIRYKADAFLYDSAHKASRLRGGTIRQILIARSRATVEALRERIRKQPEIWMAQSAPERKLHGS